jgi:hypothetical protein
VRNLLISVKLDWVFSWGIFFVHKLFIPYRNDLSLITSSLKYFLSYSYQCLFFPIKLFWTYLLLSNLVSYFFLKYCSCRVLLIGYFKSVRFHAHSPQIVHFMPINMPRKSKTTYIAYFGGFVSSSIYFHFLYTFSILIWFSTYLGGIEETTLLTWPWLLSCTGFSYMQINHLNLSKLKFSLYDMLSISLIFFKKKLVLLVYFYTIHECY